MQTQIRSDVAVAVTVAVAPIQPLTWELLYAASTALKSKKKKKKKRQREKEINSRLKLKDK